MKQEASTELIDYSTSPRTASASKPIQTNVPSIEFDTRLPKTIFGFRRPSCVAWCLFLIYVSFVITAGPLLVYFTAQRSTNVTCQRTFIRTAQQPSGYDSRPQHIIIADFDADQHLDFAVANGGSDSIDVFLGHGNGTFAPKMSCSVPRGSRPLSMVQGDFNHDQHIDIAVVNRGTNSIGIHFGQGDGTFRDAILHPLGSSRPSSIAAGDINRDNQSDLIVANHGVASVVILLGSHDGSFRVSTTYELGYDSTPLSIHVDDFNHDRVLDIALVDSSLSELVILLSSTTSESGHVIHRYSTGTGSHPSSLAIGDFNRDGHLDVAVANQDTHSIVIFSGSSNGSFDPDFEQYELDGSATAKSIVAVDMTNDTRLDLLLIDSNNDQLLIFEGLANGRFTLLMKRSTGYLVDSSFIAVGDFDEDNIPDVVISNNNTNTILIRSSFRMYLNGNRTQYLSGLPPKRTTAKLADVNGDGEFDVIMGSFYESRVGVLLGRGNGTFDDVLTFSVNSTYVRSLALADMNGDDKLDLVIGQYYISTILIYHGSGNGSFVYGETIDLGDGRFAGRLALADFNNDGVIDIVFTHPDVDYVNLILRSNDQEPSRLISYPTGGQTVPWQPVSVDLNKDGLMDFVLPLLANRSISIYLNDGNGTFQDPIGLSVDVPRPVGLAIGDLNGDGHLDLVFVAPQEAMVGIILARQDGTFSNFTLYPTGSETFPSALVLGYFDNDTYLDIAVTKEGGHSVLLLLGFGDGTFGRSQIFPLEYGVDPSWIAMEDLNHDGQNDLVVTHSVDSIIDVFLIHLEADFLIESTHRLASGPHPSLVLVADFNNNSRLDVAVANPGNDDVQILLDHNSKTFSRMPRHQLLTGSHPQYVAAVDLNNDRHLDLVVANTWVHNIQVLLGEGNGTFDPPSTYSTGIGSAPHAIGVGNFNEDAWMDVAVVNRDTDEIQIFIGFDYSTFTQQQIPVVGVDSYPWSLAIGDFDEDGFNDIAMTNYKPSTIDLFFGNGDGTFKSQRSFSTGPSSKPFAIRVTDIDDDNHLDLIVAGETTLTLGVFLGNGNGSFVRATSSPIVRESQFTFHLVDVNNDTYLDIITMTVDDNSLSVYLGDGTGLFTTEITHPIPNDFYALNFETTDLNHDHIVDVILPNFDSNIFFVLLGQGNGSFHDPISYSTGDVFNLSAIASGDLDNDGNTDLVFDSLKNETLLIYFGSGDGAFPHSMTLFTGAGSSSLNLVIDDLNDDSIPDIVFLDIGSGAGNLAVFYGRGNRSFAIRKNYLLNSATVPQDIQIADLNTDGKLDVVIIDNINSVLFILIQLQYDPFSTPVTLPLSTGSHPTAIAVADIDHDHHLDIIVVNSGTRTLDLLCGLGDASFDLLPILSTPLDSSPNAIAVADANGDGHPDFVLVLAETSQLMMYLGDGRRVFRWSASYSTGVSSWPSAVAASDVNDDGRIDVVVCNSGTNEVMIFYGQSDGTLSSSMSYALGFNARPQSVAVGDVNGDGMVDLVVANNGNNMVEVLLQICLTLDTISS